MPTATLALPLRVEPDGRLARGAPAEGLVRLFRVMAATQSTAWPHAPWFGLQEVFAAANPQLEDQQGIADALNVALLCLGVDWAWVASAQSVPANYGERAFRIALQLADGGVTHVDLGV